MVSFMKLPECCFKREPLKQTIVEQIKDNYNRGLKKFKVFCYDQAEEEVLKSLGISERPFNCICQLTAIEIEVI